MKMVERTMTGAGSALIFLQAKTQRHGSKKPSKKTMNGKWKMQLNLNYQKCLLCPLMCNIKKGHVTSQYSLSDIQTSTVVHSKFTLDLP